MNRNGHCTHCGARLGLRTCCDCVPVTRDGDMALVGAFFMAMNEDANLRAPLPGLDAMRREAGVERCENLPDEAKPDQIEVK